MLVPLETLSGWPQVENPTPLQVLGLLVGIPLLIAIIVIAIIEIGARARAGRDDIIEASDPLWVGAHQSAELEANVNPGLDTGEQATAGDADAEGDDTGEHVGGAGARW
jgi:hypothetical protein